MLCDEALSNAARAMYPARCHDLPTTRPHSTSEPVLAVTPEELIHVSLQSASTSFAAVVQAKRSFSLSYELRGKRPIELSWVVLGQAQCGEFATAVEDSGLTKMSVCLVHGCWKAVEQCRDVLHPKGGTEHVLKSGSGPRVQKCREAWPFVGFVELLACCWLSFVFEAQFLCWISFS